MAFPGAAKQILHKADMARGDVKKIASVRKEKRVRKSPKKGVRLKNSCDASDWRRALLLRGFGSVPR